jgi:hypothetical protein
MELQQLHLQMSCPSLQSLTVFSSSVEADDAMYYLPSHDLYACNNDDNVNNNVERL